ncbi:aspartate aminotransferase family protein [Microvirga massiliensis]|uniref:aspartate aminotransferase family protein n=1 Tax=Microvirga massiliensis TaxID=1033741 RepID=UPI00062BD7FD|nr:aminotransferase class III-fold pyridoxal phosphate-dependent enzyme [Microvirga massiliensis]
MENSQLSNSLTSLREAIKEAHDVYARKRPKSAELSTKARQVMPGGNTRTLLSYRPFPTAMARGEGCRLQDIDGNDYLDLCGEYSAGLFGHSERTIHDAIRGALSNGVSLAAVGAAEEALARGICSRFSSIDRIRFTNSGTEANIMALTAARAYTQRSKVLVFRGAYHGGVLSFPVSGPTTSVPFPFLFGDYNDVEGTLATIRDSGSDIAAVIVEPMLGAGGCIPGSPEFIKAIRQATVETGSLLILDEVMTSRMSTGGMQRRLGISPDMTTLGKYLGGGMSFGAFGGRREIMELFAESIPHAGTFNNNVLSMAAGTAALEVFGDQAANDLFHQGESLRNRLNTACCGTGLMFTGLGSLITPHFRPGPIDRPYRAHEREDLLRELFFFDMLDAGIYTARRGMIALSLPVSQSDLDFYLSSVVEFTKKRAGIIQQSGFE